MLITHRPSVVLTPQGAGAFFRRFLPGDLIFCMADGAKGGSAIQAYQSKYGYVPKAADTTHVAIYCGNGKVVHAVRPQVRVEPVFPYFMKREVCAGRWLPLDTSPKRREALGQKIRDHAIGFSGQRYETLRLFRQVIDSKYGGTPLVCSTLVDLAYDAVLGEDSPVHAGPGPTAPFITPAHLFSRIGFR